MEVENDRLRLGSKSIESDSSDKARPSKPRIRYMWSFKESLGVLLVIIISYILLIILFFGAMYTAFSIYYTGGVVHPIDEQAALPLLRVAQCAVVIVLASYIFSTPIYQKLSYVDAFIVFNPPMPGRKRSLRVIAANIHYVLNYISIFVLIDGAISFGMFGIIYAHNTDQDVFLSSAVFVAHFINSISAGSAEILFPDWPSLADVRLSTFESVISLAFVHFLVFAMIIRGIVVGFRVDRRQIARNLVRGHVRLNKKPRSKSPN